MLKVNQLVDEVTLDQSPEEINEYISKLSTEMALSNKKFNQYISLLILAIAGHFLFTNGYIKTISFMSLKVESKKLIDIWFLLVPSALYLIVSIFGYMRIYQQGVLTELKYRFKPNEYHSGFFRLLFPANIPYALDLLRRQQDRASKYVIVFPTIFFALGTLSFPISYLYINYVSLYATYGSPIELIVSSILSLLLVLHGFFILSLGTRL